MSSLSCDQHDCGGNKSERREGLHVVNKRLDLVFRAVSEKDVGQARLGDNLALALDKFNHFYRGTKNRNSFFLQIFTRILLPSIGAAQSVPMRGCCLFASERHG